MGVRGLYRAGLTNWDGLTLEEMATSTTKKPYGYCSGRKCELNSKAVTRKGVLKTTDKSLDRCPDCGTALYWEWK
jgi:hypothetical protein